MFGMAITYPKQCPKVIEFSKNPEKSMFFVRKRHKWDFSEFERKSIGIDEKCTEMDHKPSQTCQNIKKTRAGV